MRHDDRPYETEGRHQGVGLNGEGEPLRNFGGVGRADAEVDEERDRHHRNQEHEQAFKLRAGDARESERGKSDDKRRYGKDW